MMATQFGLSNSRKLWPILAALAFLGLSACGDSAPRNECAEITCETPEAYCDGETAVSYSGGGTCIKSTGVCDIEAVERRLDCSSRIDALGEAEVCVDGACQPVDRCGADACAQPEPTCIGSTNLITYSGAGVCNEFDGTCDFAPVSHAIDCADTGEICKDGACQPVDLCEHVTCAPPGPSCNGDLAVTYTGEAGTCQQADGTCEFPGEFEETDCAASDQVCQLGACVDEAVDLCVDETCDAPAATCEGDVAVTYSGAGTCLQTDGSCDFADVKVETDCSATSQICEAGACVDDTEPSCDGVTCDQSPAPFCEGDVAVTFTGNDGVCVEADGSCDYTAEEVRVDCSATGESCAGGACVTAGDHSVNPGDLVFTEIMADPAVVTDAVGEYFEIYNTTGRTLHIDGLVISDKNDVSFDVVLEPAAPIEVAPQSYFVFGKNADSATNGGIDVDFVWSGFNLTNSADTLVITRPGTPDIEIARIEYGGTSGLPSVKAGKSMQFGSGNDFADYADGTLWCDSTEPINPGDTSPDLGTPGAANSTCD